jgi:hypothetical protein
LDYQPKTEAIGATTGICPVVTYFHAEHLIVFRHGRRHPIVITQPSGLVEDLAKFNFADLEALALYLT